MQWLPSSTSVSKMTWWLDIIVLDKGTTDQDWLLRFAVFCFCLFEVFCVFELGTVSLITSCVVCTIEV